MQRLPYLSDPKLIPRVQRYLEANVDKNYIDIGSMADELQSTYREYSRKKRNAFRTSVEKAYSVVLRSYGLADQSDDTSEDKIEEDVDSENSRESQLHNNIMNNQLVELYKRPTPTPSVPKMNINELIDISSDDSKEESKLPPAKDSNGPSSSSKATRIDLSNNFQENMEKISIVSQGRKRKPNIINKMNKRRKIEYIPTINLTKIIGMESIVNDLSEKLFFFQFPNHHSGKDYEKPDRGFLLHGPIGSGKTFLAHAIAGHLSFPLITVKASDLKSDSDKSVTEIFRNALCAAPAVLLLENIDSVKDEKLSDIIVEYMDYIDQNDVPEKFLVIATAVNLNSVDTSLVHRLSNEIRIKLPNEESRIKMLKAFTSEKNLKPDFDWNRIAYVTPGYCVADLKKLVKTTWIKSFWKATRERYIQADEKDKREINLNSLTIEPEIIVDDDSKETSDKDRGNSSQDDNLVLVIEDENSKQGEIDISSSTVPTAAKNSDEEMMETSPEKEINVVPEQKEEFNYITTLQNIGKNILTIDQLVITEEDFIQAAKDMQPLSIKKGLITVPNVCWDDIGSLKDVRAILEKMFITPLKLRKSYEAMNLDLRGGVLLVGPPGCGKTLLAKALANEAHLNFFSVKGPELINKYVGESERSVRNVFEQAKNAAPSLIFFDEMDALCPKRQGNGEGDFISRVVAAMLAEMDGIESLDGVYLLGATNRPDIIDSAILRPGRFDKVIYVGVPSADDRVEILKTLTRNLHLGPDVDLEDIGTSEKLSGCTGADLKGLVREACQSSIQRNTSSSSQVINKNDLEKTMRCIRPSVSEEVLKHYEGIRARYCIQ